METSWLLSTPMAWRLWMKSPLMRWSARQGPGMRRKSRCRGEGGFDSGQRKRRRWKRRRKRRRRGWTFLYLLHLTWRFCTQDLGADSEVWQFKGFPNLKWMRNGAVRHLHFYSVHNQWNQTLLSFLDHVHLRFLHVSCCPLLLCQPYSLQHLLCPRTQHLHRFLTAETRYTFNTPHLSCNDSILVMFEVVFFPS